MQGKVERYWLVCRDEGVPRDKLAALFEGNIQGFDIYEVVKSTFHKIAATAAE